MCHKLCPCCKSVLYKSGMKRLETLDEHVSCVEPSLKMSYKCTNDECDAYDYAIWNEYGEVYYSKKKDVNWIDNNNAPFGTFQRRINVEVYKEDENCHWFTFPCWPMKGWKCRKKYIYTSNEDGDILKRKLTLEWTIPEGNLEVYHVWGYKMLIHGIKDSLRLWKDYYPEKGKDINQYPLANLKQRIDRSEWKNAEWWRKASAYFAKFIFWYEGIKSERSA